MDTGGTIALFRAGEEGELADDQQSGQSIDPDAYDFSLEPYAPTPLQDRPAA